MPRYLKQELKSAIMATPNCAFPKRGDKGDHTDGNSSLPRVLRPGHERASRHHQAGSKINDHLIVAVLINSAKNPLFTVEERVALLQECCKDIPNVTVEGFDGLTVEFAKKRHASVMVRGLRAVTDFENEIQLAQTNHALMPGIETMFLATSIKWSYLSSTIVKEAARYGSNISKFVTPNVEAAIHAKVEQLQAEGKTI